MIVEQQITSLAELLEYLPNSLPSEYKAIAKDMHIAPSDFDGYATWNKSKYTRNCIVRTEAYELILLCWEPGQATNIHCHGGEECWVYLVDGKIEEQNFHLVDGKPVMSETEKMKCGEVSYMNDDLGYHKLINVHAKRTMSLHLYMNPIDSCTCWNEETEEFVPVNLKYDTSCKNS